MKKTGTVLLLIVTVLFTIESNAQNKLQGMELGLRLGGFSGGGVAVDGTFPLGNNRIHADLGFFNNGVGLAAFYDWSFPIADGFSFYPGVGAEVGVGSTFVLGIGGELGFEYAFDIPLSIGIDWRPTIRLIDENGFGYNSFGLNIRYRF